MFFPKCANFSVQEDGMSLTHQLKNGRNLSKAQ